MANKPRILVVADYDWWVFAKMGKALQKWCTNCVVDICYLYGDHGALDRHHEYDKILWLVDVWTAPLAQRKIPRSKVILAIRSHVGTEGDCAVYGNPAALQKLCGTMAVANSRLMERFMEMHPNVVLAPGGVDADIYTYREKPIGDPPAVGWAGRVGGWGDMFRGIPIIKTAAEKLGWVFRPALEDHGLKNTKQMLEWYHTGIDIYVDMTRTAGRQNGLLEAASCGRPVVSCDAGIATDLISDGLNGYVVERNVESLVEALRNILPSAASIGKAARMSIEGGWSWEKQAVIFERMFGVGN